jgi:hypothetical protein
LRQAARLTSETATQLAALAALAEAPDYGNAEQLALVRRRLMRLHELLSPCVDALSLVERSLPKSGGAR